MKLTPKQEMFITEYMKDLNATQAAIRAGYSEKTAQEQGSRLLSNVMVKNEIDRRLKALTEKAGVTAEKVIKELAKIGFADITDYLKVDDYEYIAGYEKTEDGEFDMDKPIKKIFRQVEIFKTDGISKDKLAAISEIKQTKDGISLKLNDKIKALELLGKHLKLFTDKIESENTGNQDININFNIPRPKKE